MPTPTQGRIVIFTPASEGILPEGMSTAPAIIVQVIDENTVNLNVFVADPNGGSPCLTFWGVSVTGYVAPEGESLRKQPVGTWAWPEIVKG